MLFRAVEILKRRKSEFDAWLVVRSRQDVAGSGSRDGRSDRLLRVLRAADAVFLAAATPVQMPGEKDDVVYLPLGVGVVIPPWNFSLAILAGMTVAALVTGNTVVIKPSSETPTSRRSSPRCCWKRVSRGHSFSLLVGSGAEVGDRAGGASEDALHLVHGIARRRPAHQRTGGEAAEGTDLDQARRCEMGGKDAIVVDREADLDKAVDGSRRVRLRLSGAEVLGLLAGDRR